MSGKKRTGTDRPKPTDDAELWSRVAATVRPLRRGSAVNPPKAATGRDPAGEADPGQPERKPRQAPPRAVPRPMRAAAEPKPPPAFTGLDRRTSQKLARGNIHIEATLDLHGMTRESARGALVNFIRASVTLGRKTVLVITGKGHSPYSSHTLHGYQHVDTPEREGVIRKSFPRWLDEPELRALVSGYQPAHPRHGGGGAFYVRLRKPRS